MGKNLFVGVGGKARHVKALYVGVGGKARKVKKVYVGVGGKARLVYQSYVPVTGISLHVSSDGIARVTLSPTNASATSASWSTTGDISVKSSSGLTCTLSAPRTASGSVTAYVEGKSATCKVQVYGGMWVTMS